MMKKLNEQGFTLIELLIVVVIIGILAAIAIPKFTATRERAYYSSMRADLRNLSTQQELFYTDNNFTYADVSTEPAGLDWNTSDGVQVTGGSGDQTGWFAQVSHDALGGTEGCAVYHGDDGHAGTTPGTTPLPTETAGVIVCDDEGS